ncbi:unnamed protein product [Brassica rapa subsp. narinosa]
MELIVGGGFALLLRDSFVVAREGMLVLPLSRCLAGLQLGTQAALSLSVKLLRRWGLLYMGFRFNGCNGPVKRFGGGNL